MGSLGRIWDAAKKGWMSAGVEWREEFVEKGIDPDKFLAVPNGAESVARYLGLPPQAKIQFLNMLTRRELFERIKID